VYLYYAPPLIGGYIKRWCCLTPDVCLSICLSVAYIGPKARTERPKKTKINTEVAHLTRDSDTTFKVERSKSRSPGRFAYRRVGASGGCSGGRGNVLAVGNGCYVAVCSAAMGASAPTGEEERDGAYRGGHPPTACCWLQNVVNRYRVNEFQQSSFTPVTVSFILSDTLGMTLNWLVNITLLKIIVVS